MRIYSSHLPGKLGFGLLSLLWAAVISNFSTDRYSFSRTSSYIEPVLHRLFPGASRGTIHSLHFFIRKFGHLSEYGILAILLFGVWAAQEERWQRRWFGYTLALAGLLALLDEYHQLFTRLRVASLDDSLIDIVGAGMALLLVWFSGREKFLLPFGKI